VGAKVRVINAVLLLAAQTTWAEDVGGGGSGRRRHEVAALRSMSESINNEATGAYCEQVFDGM
jgi:hypothetical protein